MLKQITQAELKEIKAAGNVKYIAPFQVNIINALRSDKYTVYLIAGGRESGKSDALYKFGEDLLTGRYGKWKANILLIRTTKQGVKDTLLEGFIGRVLGNMGENFKDLEEANKKEGRLTVRGHKIRISSFASDNATDEKLKGYETVTHVIIEELKELKDPRMFMQLYSSIVRERTVTWEEKEWSDEMQDYIKVTKSKKVMGKIICTFNTPEENHWINDFYYDLVPSDVEGFMEIKPKSGVVDGVDDFAYDDRSIFYSFSTIWNNTGLKQTIKDRGGEKAWKLHLFEKVSVWKSLDPYRYYTEYLGLVGTGRSGRVYPNWKEIKLEEYNEIQSDIELLYGVDFGFTNDVSSVGEVKVKKGAGLGGQDVYYVKPVIYERGLLTSNLGSKIKQEVAGFSYCEFYADGSKPEAISELRMLGINEIQRTKKRNDYKTPAVTWLSGFEVYYVDITVEDKKGKQMKAVGTELAKTCWLTDKTGKSTNEPRDGDDHFLDCVLYPIYTKFHPENETVGSQLYSEDSSLIKAFANGDFDF